MQLVHSILCIQYFYVILCTIIVLLLNAESNKLESNKFKFKVEIKYKVLTSQKWLTAMNE